MRNLNTLWTLTMVLALGAGQAAGQFLWTKDARSPILSGGASGTWNREVFSPYVLFNTDSSRYEMWFGVSSGTTPSWRPYSVGFAYSQDGIDWTMYPSAVLSPTPGTWDAFTVEQPMVIRENGQYKMWYSSWYDVAPDYPNYIGYATSPDGIHWTKYPGNPVMGPGTAAWEIAGPYSCTVMPFPGGYRMWYAGFGAHGSGSSIGHAASPDGITWQRDTVNNPVLGAGSPGQWDGAYAVCPRVLCIDNTYYLWYEGGPGSLNRRMGVASSKDSGITWIKYPNNPALSPSAGTWDASDVEPGSVLQRGDTLDMWYDGADNSYVYRIGHATSIVGEAYAYDVRVSRWSIDTMGITARVENPLVHAVNVMAIFNDGLGALIDSIALADDGLHGDSAAGDGLWGYHYVPKKDDIIRVRIRTDDQTAKLSTTLPNILTYIFTRGAFINIDTRTVDFGRIRKNISHRDTTFTVRNDGFAEDSLYANLDYINVEPDSAIAVSRTAFALAAGDSAGVTFTVRPPLLATGPIYNAVVMITSRFGFGQRDFEKTMAFQIIPASGVKTDDCPKEFALRQNYPNPFNPATTIRYDLPHRSPVLLAVYNTLGQQVAILVQGEQETGYHSVRFDGSNLASGVYFYRLQAGTYMETRKFLLLR